MSQDLGEITDFKVVQVTDTTNSVTMQKEAFKHCIEDLLKADLNAVANLGVVCWVHATPLPGTTGKILLTY